MHAITHLPIAFIIDENVLALLIPVCALMIPIVAILVKHQQRMAEIVHNAPPEQNYNPEISALREELRQMSQRLDALTIAVDNQNQARASQPDGDISQRLSN